jgi:hypothetical protein
MKIQILCTLWPRATYGALQVGGLASIDLDGVQLEIVEVGQDYAEAVVTDGGQVRSNKAVTVHPAPTLPVLTDSDREAIAIGLRPGIRRDIRDEVPLEYVPTIRRPSSGVPIAGAARCTWRPTCWSPW